jgi:MSHA pilin protein MshD
MWNKRAQRGFTLIEMIVAIIVIGVGMAGVLLAYSVNVRGSADALVGKQLIAISETMMEEVLLHPFAPPVGSAGVGSAGGACGGPGSTADRTGFDEVSDYNGYQTPNICDADGNPVNLLNGYRVAVVVAPAAVGGIGVADALRVTVTAARGQQTMVLDGFKVRLPQ